MFSQFLGWTICIQAYVLADVTVTTNKNSAPTLTDLQKLLKLEKGLLGLFAQHDEMSEIATRVLEAEGFAIPSINDSDVQHTVNGYNLIKKRLRLAWPKVAEALKLQVAENWHQGLEGAVGRKVMRQLEKAMKQFHSWEENQVN